MNIPPAGALLLVVLAAPVAAADAQPAPRTPEPKVQRIVVEDDNARIDELRVRGQTRRIVVQPKKAAAYEIVPDDAGRDPSPGPGTSRGNAGQRVWNVLSF